MSTPLAQQPTISLSQRDAEAIRHAVKVLHVRADNVSAALPSIAAMISGQASILNDVVRLGGQPIRLTVSQYSAVDFAAKMVREHADQSDRRDTVYVHDLRSTAAIVQAIHDRHHRAVVIELDGQPHDGSCSWCANA